MRPRKRVLIWTESEMTRSILRVVLDARGYKAVVIERESEIWKQASGSHACLLIGLDEKDSSRIDFKLFRKFHECRAVVLPARGKHPEGLWMAELMDRLYLACVRRRGPFTAGPGAKTSEAAA